MSRRPGRQSFDWHFIERNRPHFGGDQFAFAPEAAQPVAHLRGIGHATAEQQKLSGPRSHRQREFITQSPHRIGQHLIFVHHQQRRPPSGEERIPLRFQRGHHDGGIEVFRHLASGNAHAPFAALPFAALVISESPRRHCVHRLPTQDPRLDQTFENKGFTGSGRGINDDVASGPQMTHGLLLPEVGELQRVETREMHGGGQTRVRRKLRPGRSFIVQPADRRTILRQRAAESLLYKIGTSGGGGPDHFQHPPLWFPPVWTCWRPTEPLPGHSHASNTGHSDDCAWIITSNRLASALSFQRGHPLSTGRGL